LTWPRLPVSEATELADLVKRVDFEGASTGPFPWNVESQDTDHADMHSMCSPGAGLNQCQATYSTYMQEQWNSRSLEGLARYLHAYQDSYATGHQFRTYDGTVSPSHIWSDLTISTSQSHQITQGTTAFIQSYMRFCPECFKQK
jgi:hypothetical protein